MKDVIYTSEQNDIINCKSRVMLIDANAGSGKTTTLKGLFELYPDKKILYIVYNRSMAEEAKKDMKLPNVDIYTFHGLAYKYIGKHYADKLSTSYTAMDVMNDLELNRKSYSYCFNLNNLWKEFLVSGCYSIDDFLKDRHFDWATNTQIKNDFIRLFNLKRDLKNDVKISHDFYAFLFHLTKPNLDSYDILAIDEAQDSSYSILELFNRFDGKKIAVGDTKQNIYEFRNTINMFNEVKDAKVLQLTESHRVSNEIANICKFIYRVALDKNIQMVGVNPKNEIVEKGEFKTCAKIYRNNASILEDAIQEAQKSKALYFEGGYKGYAFEAYLDFFWFMKGTNNKPKIPLLKQMEDWNHLCEYIRETEDRELIAIRNIVLQYKDNLPQMIELVKNSVVTKKSKADVMFSTIHKSKGMTYNVPLVVGNDVIDMGAVIELKATNSKFIEDITQEINVLYVAITRGKDKIVLPESLSKVYYQR